MRRRLALGIGDAARAVPGRRAVAHAFATLGFREAEPAARARRPLERARLEPAMPIDAAVGGAFVVVRARPHHPCHAPAHLILASSRQAQLARQAVGVLGCTPRCTRGRLGEQCSVCCIPRRRGTPSTRDSCSTAWRVYRSRSGGTPVCRCRRRSIGWTGRARRRRCSSCRSRRCTGVGTERILAVVDAVAVVVLPGTPRQQRGTPRRCRWGRRTRSMSGKEEEVPRVR